MLEMVKENTEDQNGFSTVNTKKLQVKREKKNVNYN